MTKDYMVKSYNFVSRETKIHEFGLKPCVAKSIVKHYNKISPENIIYFVEIQPKRYW